MADAAEDETLELDNPAGDIEDQNGDLPAETPQGEDAEDEVLVSFDGDEGAPPSGEGQDSSVIRKLREEIRKRDAELKAVKAQVPQQPQVIEVGDKPSLAACDYDEERYDAELLAWQDRKAKADQAAADARKAEEQRQAVWDKKLAEVETKKSQLGAKDYDHAAEVVRTDLNDAQQAIIIRAAEDPAKMIYALGKNPQKLAEFAKIEDPVAAIAWLVRTEGKLTVTSRRAPPPEQIVRGSAPLSNATDKHLERLEKEAERTGDRTKVVQYKRELKSKAK